MEQDNQLKEILLKSAEKASAGFTEAVMQKLDGFASAPLYYQPLVSPGLKKLFVFTFGALVAAIFGLWLIIAVANLQVITWIQNSNFPDFNYNTILMFILSFWIVFTINLLIEKKFFLRNRSHLHIS